MQELDFDKYFDCLYVARLSKDNAGALAKLAGAAETPKVQPLESGEWNGEVRHGGSQGPYTHVHCRWPSTAMVAACPAKLPHANPALSRFAPSDYSRHRLEDVCPLLCCVILRH